MAVEADAIHVHPLVLLFAVEDVILAHLLLLDVEVILVQYHPSDVAVTLALSHDPQYAVEETIHDHLFDAEEVILVLFHDLQLDVEAIHVHYHLSDVEVIHDHLFAVEDVILTLAQDHLVVQDHPFQDHLAVPDRLSLDHPVAKEEKDQFLAVLKTSH